MFSRAINSYLSWKYPIVRSPKIVKRLKPQVMASIIDPTEEKWQIIGYRYVTAYSSSVDETDDTPFITASGQKTRDGIIATNELKFGEIVRVAGKEYEVQDRMNSRYNYRYDIWKPSKQEALNFGKQILLIEKKL